MSLVQDRWSPPGKAIAIIRHNNADRLLEIACTIIDGGVECLEFSLASQGALDAMNATASLRPAATVGAGTVTRISELADAIAAGAQFALTPFAEPGVLAFARSRSFPLVVGAFTPTEVIGAWRDGADAVKIFPASLGGPDYIKTLLGPFPELRLIPTGGVPIDAVNAYLAAGAVAVGISSPLVGSGDLTDIARRVGDLIMELGHGKCVR